MGDLYWLENEAYAHGDACAASLTWSSRTAERSPCDELMAAEEMEIGAEDEEVSLAFLFSSVLEFIFSDRKPDDWRYAAARSIALIRVFHPLLLSRGVFERLGSLEMTGEFPLSELVAAFESGLARRQIRKFLEWIFPRRSEHAFRAGVQNFYILAAAYHQHSVTLTKLLANGVVRQSVMSFTDMSEAFGEVKKGENSARARWSARSEKLFSPLEQAGIRTKISFQRKKKN